MHTVFIGYSVSLSGNEMIQYFDIDPDHEERISKFEQSFGCEYVGPGSFEVYDCSEYQDFGFNGDLFSKLVPFEPDRDMVDYIDFSSAKSIFYIVTSLVKKMDNDDIRLFGPMKIEKFDFE